MEIEDLAKQVRGQHQETQFKLRSLDDKMECVKVEQVKIRVELELGTVKKAEYLKDKVDYLKDCETCRSEVYSKIRRTGVWNKIATFIAVVAAGLVGYLGLRGK